MSGRTQVGRASLETLALFSALEDSRQDLRALREPEPVEETPPGWKGNPLTTLFIGFGPGMAPPPGPDRGAIEQTLIYLAGRVEQFERRKREGAA